MKKTWKILCTLMVIGCLMGCSSEIDTTTAGISTETETTVKETESKEEISFTPGTYTGTAKGMYGDVTVEVVVDATSILSVKVEAPMDTAVVANPAIEDMTTKIVETQSLGIDTTTGATMTSLAIKNAVKAALEDVCSGYELLTADYELPTVQYQDEEVDIVIVGAGGAGLGAALEISDKSDYTVLVLEKNDWIGGSTALSGGAFTVANTEHNDMTGLDYKTGSDYADYLVYKTSLMKMNNNGSEVNYEAATEIGNRLIEYSPKLLEKGLPVFASMVTGILDYEKGIGNTAVAGDGQAMWGEFLPNLVKENGVEIRTGSRVTALTTENGKVTGVVVETADGSYTVHAQKVILATGGFTANSALMKEKNEEYYPGIQYTWCSTNGTNTGDAFAFVEEAGLNPAYTGYGLIHSVGSIYNYGIETAIGPTLNTDPLVLINENGEWLEGSATRWYYENGAMISNQPNGYVWSILDYATLERNGAVADAETLIEKGYAYKADSLEDLAAALGFEAEVVTSACQQAMINAQTEYSSMMWPVSGSYITSGILDGPYYAIKTYGNSLASLYGFKLDGSMHIVNTNGESIENLFAAGEVALGNFFFETYIGSGNAVACSFYGGIYAADIAMEELATE